MDSLSALFQFFKRNTWAIVFAAILIAFLWPELGLLLQPWLTPLLMFLMLLSCLDINARQVLLTLKSYRENALVLAVIHLASPLAVLLLKPLFPSELYLGLILAASVPSGRSAVFISTIYGGLPTKALVISSLSNALSPVIVPLLTWTFAHTVVNFNAVNMGSTLVTLVIVPLVAAMLVRPTKVGHYLAGINSGLSSLIVFFIILGIISPLIPIITANPAYSLLLTLLITLLSILNFFLGYSIGGNQAEKVTYAITSSYKNYTLATVVAVSLFTPLVALPSIIYAVVGNLLLIPFQFSRLHPSQSC